jgi:hypothetical protein
MGLEKYHPCPICFQSVSQWKRYPRVVRGDYYNKACNAQGQKLSFLNLSMGGGFEAFVTETQEKYLSHVCYAEGVECKAFKLSMARIGLIAGFELFNIDLYRKATKLALAHCPGLEIYVFSEAID